MQAVAEDGAARIEQLEQQMRQLRADKDELVARIEQDKAELVARCERDKAAAAQQMRTLSDEKDALAARCGQVEQALHRLQAEKDAMMGCLLAVCGPLECTAKKDAMMGCLRDRSLCPDHACVGVTALIGQHVWLLARGLQVFLRGDKGMGTRSGPILKENHTHVIRF